MHYHCPIPRCEAIEYISCCGPGPMELAVVVDRQGHPTNRWEDGVVGVPDYLIDWIRASDCAPYCPLHYQETEWREA